MLRKLSLVLLVSPAFAVAQVPPAPPSPPVNEVAPPAEAVPSAEALPPAEVVPPAEAAPPAEPSSSAEAEAAPEEPKMKRVCHQEDVVGSAFPRMVCKMKPIKPPKSAS